LKGLLPFIRCMNTTSIFTIDLKMTPRSLGIRTIYPEALEQGL
jgi:hypothetical protein